MKPCCEKCKNLPRWVGQKSCGHTSCECHSPKGETPLYKCKINTDSAMAGGCNHASCAPTQPESKGWEERFDETDFGFFMSGKTKHNLLAFIRAEIKSHGDGQYLRGCTFGREGGLKQGRQDVIAELMKKLPKAMTDEESGGQFIVKISYNSCRNRVLDLLTVMRKEI